MFNSRYFITSVLVKKLSLTLGFSFIDSFVAGNPVKEKKNILTLHKIVRKTLLGTSMIVVKTIAETSGSTVDSVKTTGDL